MFEDMNKSFIAALAGAVVEKDAKDYEKKPQDCTPEEAAKFMVGKKRIMVLTGAGISAASGIPTFRGQDGFWK